MNNPFGRQLVSLGQTGLSRRAAVYFPAFFKKFPSGRAMNGAVHTASAQEGAVGRVYNGIHPHDCYIPCANLDYIRNKGQDWHDKLLFLEYAGRDKTK
jgi:hypothetical protein